MTEVEIWQHYNVKVDLVICDLCKNYLIQIHFCNFLFLLCFILYILRGKNQKLLSRFSCCKSSVLVCLNVFISWLKSRDLFSVKLCTTGKYPTHHLCDILLEAKTLPLHHLHYKSCWRSLFSDFKQSAR